jgi:hypothetical protein
MPSSWSASLRFELQFTGENINLWGDKLNAVLQHVDYSGGRLAHQGAHRRLCADHGQRGDDEARAAMLKFTGAGRSPSRSPASARTTAFWKQLTSADLSDTAARDAAALGVAVALAVAL